MSPHKNTPLGKTVEEYFREKNAADIELYEKAVKVFRNRFPEDATGSKQTESRTDAAIVIETGSKSYDVQEERDAALQATIDALLRGEDISRKEYVISHGLGNYPERWKAFYNLVVKLAEKDDEPLHTLHKYYCCIRLEHDKEEVSSVGNNLFDIMDEADKENNASALVRLRLRMLDRLLDRWTAFGKNPFAERAILWLRCLRNAPGWKGTALHFETLLLEACGDRKAALQCARNAVDVTPDSDEFHNALAKLLIANGNADEAETDARKALEIHPEKEWALKQLAGALKAKNDVTGAEEAFKKAFGKNPFWAEGYFEIAKMLQAHGKTEQGLEYAKKALALQPRRRAIMTIIAQMLRTLGKKDECEKFCRDALGKDEKQGWAWRELCRLALDQGDKKAAVEFGEKAIEAHPLDEAFNRFFKSLS